MRQDETHRPASLAASGTLTDGMRVNLRTEEMHVSGDGMHLRLRLEHSVLLRSDGRLLGISGMRKRRVRFINDPAASETAQIPSSPLYDQARIWLMRLRWLVEPLITGISDALTVRRPSRERPAA